jgi:hypothetical protein
MDRDLLAREGSEQLEDGASIPDRVDDHQGLRVAGDPTGDLF